VYRPAWTFSDYDTADVCWTPPLQYTAWSGYPPTAPQPQQSIMAAQQQQMNTTTNNIIITTQPGAVGRPVKRDWSSGLCDCFSDMGICLLGWCCPLWLQCSIVQDLGDPCCDAFCLRLCAPAALFVLRAHMRGKENIRGTFFDDFSKTTGCCNCCYPCVLCQLARESSVPFLCKFRFKFIACRETWSLQSRSEEPVRGTCSRNLFVCLGNVNIANGCNDVQVAHAATTKNAIKSKFECAGSAEYVVPPCCSSPGCICLPSSQWQCVGSEISPLPVLKIGTCTFQCLISSVFLVLAVVVAVQALVEQTRDLIYAFQHCIYLCKI
ncbi:hypothetical protein Btru_041640, partial [Bulinus truncatus]